MFFFVRAKGIPLSEMLFALKYMTWKTTVPSFISSSRCSLSLHTPEVLDTQSMNGCVVHKVGFCHAWQASGHQM